MKKLTLTILVLVNLIPVLGVFLLEWDLFSILFFYWLESAVVGVYNIARMAMTSAQGHKLSGILFFMVHYSVFMLGHGFFLYGLFSPIAVETVTVVLGILALSVSHGVSFAVNFVGHKEYERVSLSEQMVAPYGRIMVMHITIILCAFLLNLFGSPQITLVLLVFLKIIIDVFAHLKEHQKLGTYVKTAYRAMPDQRHPTEPPG